MKRDSNGGSGNIVTDPALEPPPVETYIAQKYIENPYLIGGMRSEAMVTSLSLSTLLAGKKFDIRLYTLVVSYNPLIIYIHRVGFCRFSNYQYSLAKEDISNLCMAVLLGNTHHDCPSLSPSLPLSSPLPPSPHSSPSSVIHATNVAIQKSAPEYNGDKGCKWQLRQLRPYLASRHGADVADQVFTNMEALIVRSLMSVQKVMIHDKHCFEL